MKEEREEENPGLGGRRKRSVNLNGLSFPIPLAIFIEESAWV